MIVKEGTFYYFTMGKKKLSLLTILLIIVLCTAAQDKSVFKFGKISAEDFGTGIYSIDSNANAIVLADIGWSEISTSSGRLALENKRFKRVHILNKNGYNAATVEILLYVSGGRIEDLDYVKATTYNLENGKVVETKLEKNSVFTEKIDKKNWQVSKFTFPNIKEGSIIEYEYKVVSGFLLNLQPWIFQGEYPVLWSEYNLSRPEFVGYVFLSQGYQPYFIKEEKDGTGKFRMADDFNARVTNYRWVMKDVPALKVESNTTTLNNHIARLSFLLSDFRYPLMARNVIGSWEDVCKNLLRNENFGLELDRINSWLGDVVKPLLSEATNDLEKTKRIYTYIRDNILCVSHVGKYLTQTLKDVLKTKRGTVADMNLLLIAMLRYANIKAEPVILSTRSHGYTYSIYPILERFNYVICIVHADNQNIYLDASWPRLGFGKLPSECFNGHARIVNEKATLLTFSSDSLLERKVTSIELTIDDKGNFGGFFQQMPGYYESHSIREEIKEKGKEEFFKNKQKESGQFAELIVPKIDSIDKLEENIHIRYQFKINSGKEDVIYLNPMFEEGYKQNPFKSAQRFYPVEMPYTKDETYVFSMPIPEGYLLDELPGSMMVKLNEKDDGVFEYRISESAGTISLRSRVRIRRTFYQPEEYELLREFFNLIVSKQSEQIVFKKKN